MTSLARFSQLRPTPARWFETYVPRNQTVYALEALAGTGLVELEVDPRFASPLVINEVRETTHQFDRLSLRYADDLPASATSSPHLPDAPEQTGHQALAILRNYCAKVACLRRRGKHLEKELVNLLLILDCLTGPECPADVLDGFSHESDFLCKKIFANANTTPLTPELNESAYIKISGKNHEFFIVAALPEKAVDIDAVFSNCQKLDIPPWLTGDCPEKKDLLLSRIRQLKLDLSDKEQSLLALHHERLPSEAVANLTILRWFVENAPELGGEQKLCHVSGWTTAEQPGELQNALNQASIAAIIRYSDTPEGIWPPVMAFRSPWAAPFRIFVELLGTPGKMEIDPSVLLPGIVPLLFGFMFPDIGHGLVLLLAGLLFRAQPKLRILVPCGLYAIAFGFLFGSFFGHHDVVPALWFYPMEEPIKVLVICMVFGFCLILLSIVFSGIEAYWKEKLHSWLILEVAVLALYTSGLIGLFIPEAFMVTPIALGLYLLGIVITYQGSFFSNIINGIGSLIESIFELTLHTLSFMRVGVFALAHEGMTIAVNQLSTGIENIYLYGLALVIGHLFVITVETLIVFIQTTRLVLFEFFIRFLRAEGRVFHPLNLPAGKPRKSFGHDD